MEFAWIIFRSLIEYITNIPASEEVSFVIHPLLKLIGFLLLSTIKDWGISKQDQTIV